MSHKHNLNTYTPDFTIDPITREIIQVSNPENPIRLMQFDHNSEKLRFSCPRYIDGHDMAQCNKLEVHFVNSDVANEINNSGAYRVVDLEVDSADSSKINFSWVVSKNATGNVGTLVFSVRFTCLTGDEIDYVWHTLSFTYISVDQGLVSEISEEYQKIYLDNLETEAGKKVVEAGEATNSALEAAERASEAINELYSMDVTDKSPAIVCGVVGKTIQITDSAEMPIKGLRVFGKTTQDGTPTPDAPVALVSVGDTDSIVVNVYGKNLINVTAMENEQLTNNGDGTYTLTKNGSGTARFSARSDCNLPKGMYLLSVKSVTDDENVVRVAVTFADGSEKAVAVSVGIPKTVEATSEIVKVAVYIPADRDNGTTSTFSGLQMEIGNVATAYESNTDAQTITVSTVNGLHGIPVTSDGNYTDENGQQWVCDEVDLERGVYVKRIGVIDSYNAEEITTKFMSTTGQLSTGARILYVEHEVVETPLTETEIAAYKALHTNYPNTVVMSEADMEVKYAADTKLYIDKKIKELVTALVNN